MRFTPDEVGLALVVLALVFAGAALVRRWSPQLRALFVPTAVIGGFLVLALGPEGVGRITGGYGIFSAPTFRVWRALPGLLINGMASPLPLGLHLPAVQAIWSDPGRHVISAGRSAARPVPVRQHPRPGAAHPAVRHRPERGLPHRAVVRGRARHPGRSRPGPRELRVR